MSTDRLQAQLLGPPRFLWADQPLDLRSHRGAALLAVAALRRSGISRAELAALLWGPDRMHNLRQELYRLRRLPGAAHWLDAGDPIRVRAAVDVHHFEAAVARGDDHEALAWWRGGLMSPLDAGETFERWVEDERNRLAQLRDQAWTRRHRAWRAMGELAAIAQAAEEALALDPLDALAHEARIELACRDGDRALAQERLGEAARLGADSAVARWSVAVEALTANAPMDPELLPADLRQLVQVLALEHPLPAELLGQILGLEPLDLARRLEAAVTLGWLDGAGQPRARDAVRASLPEAVRRLLHGRIAEALPEDDPRAAEHLVAAGLPDQAAHRLIAIARTRGDERAAAQAATLAQDPARIGRALALQAGLQRARGQASTALARLEGLALRTQHPEALALAALERSEDAVVQHALPSARQALTEAQGLVEDHALDLGARVAIAAGAIHLAEGDRSAAKDAFAAALTQAQDPLEQARALNALGATHAQLKRMDEADAAHREALAIARQAGLRPMALRLLNSLGANAHRRGLHAEAARRFQGALEVAIEVEDRILQRTALANLVTVLHEAGRIGESRPSVAALIDVCRATDDRCGLAWAWRLRGRLEQFSGRFAEAVSWSLRSAEAYLEAGDRPNADTSRFNAALQRWQDQGQGWAEVEQALLRFAAGERRDLAEVAGWEAARIAPDPEALARAVRSLELTPSRRALLAQRAALLGGSTAPVDGLAAALDHAAGVDRVLAHGLRALTDGADRAAELAQAREFAERAADGLLPSQLAALRDRLDLWCADPLRDPWF